MHLRLLNLTGRVLIAFYDIIHLMTQTRTYSLAVEPQESGYLAYFPALPGCHTWGRTFEEAVKNAEEALAVYIETLSAHGDIIPEDTNTEEPVSLGVTVRTPVNL